MILQISSILSLSHKNRVKKISSRSLLHPFVCLFVSTRPPLFNLTINQISSFPSIHISTDVTQHPHRYVTSTKDEISFRFIFNLMTTSDVERSEQEKKKESKFVRKNFVFFFELAMICSIIAWSCCILRRKTNCD